MSYLRPRYGVMDSGASLETLSRCAFHFDMARVDMIASTGAFWAESGHTGSLIRAATGTAVDSLGTTYTAQYTQPRYERRDWLNTGSRQTFGLMMGSADRIPFGVAFRPQAIAGYVEFIEVAGAYISISNPGVTGARLVIDRDGSNRYRVTHHNGTTDLLANVATAATAGQRVRLHWQVASNGAVSIWQSLNESAYITATSGSSLAFASTWGAGDAYVNINSIGSGTIGQMWFRRLKFMMSNPSLSVIQTVR